MIMVASQSVGCIPIQLANKAQTVKAHHRNDKPRDSLPKSKDGTLVTAGRKSGLYLVNRETAQNKRQVVTMARSKQGVQQCDGAGFAIGHPSL